MSVLRPTHAPVQPESEPTLPLDEAARRLWGDLTQRGVKFTCVGMQAVNKKLVVYASRKSRKDIPQVWEGFEVLVAPLTGGVRPA
jgi:hypothetical protein